MNTSKMVHEEKCRTVQKFCAVYRESTINIWTHQKWFMKKNAAQSKRPIEIDSNQIKTLIENNQCYIMQKIANIVKISKSSNENHLHWFGDDVYHFDM